MKRLLILLVLIFGLASSVVAQTPIETGKSFSVAADCTACATQGVTAFKWYLNTAQVGSDQPISAMVGTIITSPAFAGLAAGTYTITCATVNPVAVSAKSVGLIVTAMPAPTPPTNLRIVGTTVIAVASDGTATILSQTSTVETIK